jgi:diadenosine tetraphosphate (Ap4A) HIT family hydrolase
MADEISPCPFCNIAASNPPAPFNDPESGSSLSESTSDGTAHLILSTEHVLAFLDIMPLTNGHVLIAPRRHYEKLGDMGVVAGQEVCSFLVGFPWILNYVHDPVIQFTLIHWL